MVKLRGEVLKVNKNKKCNVIEIKKVRRVRVYAFDFVQFLTFWRFDQRFNKRIFTPVCMWKFETSAYLIYTTYKMWSHDFFCKYFLVCNLLLEMSTSTKALKLKFRCNKFKKFTGQNTFPGKVTWPGWWQYWPTSLIKEYPKWKFQLYIMSGNFEIGCSNE